MGFLRFPWELCGAVVDIASGVIALALRNLG